MEMKRKNEALKTLTYVEFWKQSSTTQHILLSTLDLDKGQFHLAFLEKKVLVPKSENDYKSYVFSFYTKQIHLIYQIDLKK